jgi:hypothetical protein
MNLFELDQPVVADRVHAVGGRTRKGDRSGGKRCNGDRVAPVRRVSGEWRSGAWCGGERCSDDHVAPARQCIGERSGVDRVVAGLWAGRLTVSQRLSAFP